jgi:hypothetical protein
MHPALEPSLEPGAVTGKFVANGLPPNPIVGPAEWGTLSGSVPPSFSTIETVELPAGTTLYRVFSSPTSSDPYPSWEIGSWWSPVSIPATEALWRGGFAVEISWNGGQYCVAWTVPATVYAWTGATARQYGEYTNGEISSDSYLPGGYTQVYVDPAKMDIGNWLPDNSPWNPYSLEAPSAVALTDAGSGYEGLMQRLGEFSAVIGAMAGEGEHKGLVMTHLRSKAARVAKAISDLGKYSGASAPAYLRAVTQNLTALPRHVQTYYPWSRHSAEAERILTDIVQRAYALSH